MRAVIALLGILAALPLRAENGVTDKEVLLGQPAAFSGPSAGVGTEMWRGAEAAFAEANAKGGVHGRRVRLVVADDAYDPEKAAQAAFQLIARDKVFALFGGVGTPTLLKAMPVVLKYFNTEGLFYFSNFTGAQPQREPPFDRAVFNIRASYREETRAIVEAYARMGKRRIGVFRQDDAYGVSGREGVKLALRAIGLDIAAETTYPRGQLYAVSTESQLKILREAGVDAVVTAASYQPCAALVRDARRGGWEVPIHGLSFMGANLVLSLLRQEEKAGGPPLTRNLFVTQVVPNYQDEGIPFIARYRAAMDRFPPGAPPAGDGRFVPQGKYSFASVEGYLSARAFLAVLEKAGPALTHKSFYQAAEQMGRFDLGLGTPLEFSPTRHQALDTVWFTTVTQQGWQSVKDPASLLGAKP